MYGQIKKMSVSVILLCLSPLIIYTAGNQFRSAVERMTAALNWLIMISVGGSRVLRAFGGGGGIELCKLI